MDASTVKVINLMAAPANTMIRWTNRIFLISFFFFCLIFLCTSQDIFDIGHSLEYAKHLEAKGDYHLAAKELTRVSTLLPQNDSISLSASICYKKAGLPDSAILAISDRYTRSPELYYEYLNLLLLTKKYTVALQTLQNDTILDEKSIQLTKLDIYFLQGNWKKALWQLQQVDIEDMKKITDYNHLVNKGIHAKYKKPALAFLLSMVLPGAGKVYAGQTWDGVMTFGIVSVLAFSSYRGFYGGGGNSFPGWIFATAASGFYISNLYGSVKAAKKYNRMLDEKLHDEVENVVFRSH